jgi:hypothetical protein
MDIKLQSQISNFHWIRPQESGHLSIKDSVFQSQDQGVLVLQYFFLKIVSLRPEEKLSLLWKEIFFLN